MATLNASSPMEKAAFLDDPDVTNFIAYLSLLLTGDTFNHQFAIPKKGRLGSGWIIANDNKDTWTCRTLEQAARQYFWPGTPGDKTDFASNNTRLSRLAGELRSEFKKLKTPADEGALLLACMNVLEWGGVQNGAYGITRLFCDGNLANSISGALKNLNSYQVDLAKFKGGEHKMNASFTKIYSLLSPKPFIIYDSRVAAALGLIAKRFWEDQGNTAPFPEALQFFLPEGRGGNRDPGDTCRFRFPSTPSPINHAKWNVRSNWMVAAAMK